MRRALGLAAALVAGLAGTVLAGAMYRNDSGAVARAVRIEFSEPAEITSTYPSFPERDPQGAATVIVLSGGEVPAGGWLSFSWRPDEARVVRLEWFREPPPRTAGTGGSSPNWDSMPWFLEYRSYDDVDFWRDGPQPLAAARFWKRDGYDVRGLKVYIDEQQVAIQITIRSSTANASYSYNIRFTRGTEEFHVNVYPRDRIVGLGYSDGSAWYDRGVVPRSCLAVDGSTFTITLRAEHLPRPFHPLQLTTWNIQLHLLYYYQTPHEWFAFPGRKTYEGYLLGMRFLRGDCLPWTDHGKSAFPNPTGTANVISGIYELTRTPRSRTGIGPYRIPVYLSVPYLTPLEDVFEVVVDSDQPLMMSRVDEVNLAGIASITGLPRTVRLEVRRNGQEVLEIPEYLISNSYEAISIGLPRLEGVVSCEPMPRDFVRAAAVTDIWGRYLYGAQNEWPTVHLRNYFDSTCARLARAGFTDVYVNSFLSYLQLEPMPILCLTREEYTSGAYAIKEDDLRKLVETAHRHGLRFHLMYAASEHDISREYLGREDKPAAWIESLLDQYEEIMLAEAAMAERCGVDSLVLGWGVGSVTYGNHEKLWGTRWQLIFHKVRDKFSGLIEYHITTSEELEDILLGRIPAATYSQVDGFLVAELNRPVIHSNDDSVERLYWYFEAWLAELVNMKKILQKPIVLDIGFQSYDGYLIHGWFDATVGIAGPTGPDFFEHARIYEALFQVLRRTTAVDGLISYKYHWDDPFGPDLGVPALARMDLEGSIRNKPAEAVVKKWFRQPATPP